MSLRTFMWDLTTRFVADSIAIFDPMRAAKYRASRNAYKRAYVAARTTGAYQLNRPTNMSGDAEVLAARQKVTANVRDMVRNNPLVAGIVYKMQGLVIGDEVGLKCQIKLPDGKPNRKLNAEIERRFYRWAESCGLAGESLTDLCYLVESHLLQDGEVLQKDVLRSAEGKNPYRLQILETDYLDVAAGQYGVFYDADGVAVAYQVYNQHPQGLMLGNSKGMIGPKSEKMAAKDFRLLIESDRSSQKRGISRLASAVFKLNGVDDLEDAEMIASRSAAAFGLVVTSPMPSDWNPYTGSDGSSEAPTDDNGRKLEYMQAGGIYRAVPGEEVKAFSSDRPNSNFDSFTRGRKRDSSGAVGMSYESATGDYSQVNYSSARLGKTVEWNTIKRRQRRIKAWLKAVVREWLRYEIALVGIPGIDVAAYRADPVKYDDFAFSLAGNEGIDPVKEIKAFQTELTLGVNNRTDFCAERGRDFAEVSAKIAEENAMLTELGISTSTADAPAAQPPMQPTDDEQPEVTPNADKQE